MIREPKVQWYTSRILDDTYSQFILIGVLMVISSIILRIFRIEFLILESSHIFHFAIYAFVSLILGVSSILIGKYIWSITSEFRDKLSVGMRTRIVYSERLGISIKVISINDKNSIEFHLNVDDFEEDIKTGLFHVKIPEHMIIPTIRPGKMKETIISKEVSQKI
jgi:hypothetical protein